jgi:O-antigen ligase
VQISVVILAALAVWLLPGAPRSMKWLVPLAVIPVGWVWLVSQRRAAVVALAVAIILLGLVLAKLNPRRLRKIAPIVALLTVAYLGAFWNSHSLLGFPADALKSVISPEEVSEKDQSSDVYRTVENFDIAATIHAKPLTGLGFGQRFYRPIPLPDISFFPFYEFMPHNSVLWMWIKTGIGGFIAMLFVFGSAVRIGIRTILRLERGRDVMLAFAALSYVVMYLVYAYVDVAWDARSMISLAVAMAICSDFLRIPDGDDEQQARSSGRARPSGVPARLSGAAAT